MLQGPSRGQMARAAPCLTLRPPDSCQSPATSQEVTDHLLILALFLFMTYTGFCGDWTNSSLHLRGVLFLPESFTPTIYKHIHLTSHSGLKALCTDGLWPGGVWVQPMQLLSGISRSPSHPSDYLFDLSNPQIQDLWPGLVSDHNWREWGRLGKTT